jgi:signal transduction histidine kinase
MLKGRLAIGPGNREDGGRIWQDLRNQEVKLHDLFQRIQPSETGIDSEVNRIVHALEVDAADTNHLLIRAVHNRQSINVVGGQCRFPVPVELLGLLEEDTFVVVPLYSPSRALGVIIADHFVSRSPITDERITALESFASQASLAIEHCHLYTGMQRKIRELEDATSELEKNKDLLVETERYSAIGHMAAQLAHNIRNPITAIGGTARLLARKIENKDWLQFLSMMASEAEKIEKILEDLFNFVEQEKPVCERTHLLQLIRKSLALHFSSMQERGIRQTLLFPEIDPVVDVDPRLMQQAFVHLIRNSIEAMHQGGKLSIEVQLEEAHVRISIRDTGKGIAEINVGRAADPFFTTKIVGTGIGLTLVKRIVEDHGGSLTLHNRNTGGMEATVMLPRAG